MFEGNSSTIRASYNPVEFSKLKHLDILYHAIRDYIALNRLHIFYIASVLATFDVNDENHACMFTKALPGKLFILSSQ